MNDHVCILEAIGFIRSPLTNLANAPRQGVFATRSSHRPNPIGLHRVSVLEYSADKLYVAPLEAIDGTPILDIKPILGDIDISER